MKGTLLAAALLFWAACTPAAAAAAAKKYTGKPKAADAKKRKKLQNPLKPRPAEHPAGNPTTSGEQPEMIPPREIPPALEQAEQPAPILRLILQPIRRGMFIRLPIVDTDPNRGVTMGFMPIWVIKEPAGERIRHIHAPSITYNRNFRVTPTYRYYYYPQEDATLIMRGSVGKFEREIMGLYEDQTFKGTDYDVLLRVQYNVDAGKRFFGVGPDTPRSNEANYKEDYFELRLGWGVPLAAGSAWRIHAADHLNAQSVDNGPIPNLAGFETRYPGLAPVHHQQTNELRLTLDFDTRDHATTTSEGGFFQVFREHAFHGFASAYEYNRSGLDARYFHRWMTKIKTTTAFQAQAEQLYGSAPFWMLPRLGGKYSLRAYGDGRYVDRGMAAANIEQRFTLFDTRMGGVTTEFEVAPFFGLGTVANVPERMSARYARPVFGGAVRAVAKPQVVGSIDFGMGQEGLAVFMDINYSF